MIGGNISARMTENPAVTSGDINARTTYLYSAKNAFGVLVFSLE
jgi:hypothetical protein